MNIIEQATQRLEELKRAGIDIPWSAVGQAGGNALAKEPAAAGTPAATSVLSAVRKDVPAKRSKEVGVDLARLAELGFVVPGRERSRWAEEFRAVKRAVLDVVRQNAQTPRRNLLMVTSALSGDGKTFCAVNLALSLAAEMDSSVMLVDADVVQPSVMTRLGIDAADSAGLLDLLAGSIDDPADVLLRPDSIPKLTLMAAGRARENASELLASGAMDKLLDELSTRYADRIVVFDAPPLLLTSEAKALARKVGQLLMVVRDGVTRIEDLTSAYACVESVPHVLSLLNGSPLEDAKPGYASGYGYAA